MPKYTPSDDEMDGSYGAEAPLAKPEEASAPAEQSVDEEAAGAAEILIEKTKLPAGIKEGETVTFKVKKDFGDEVSLEMSAAASEETEEPEEPMSAEEGELTALAGEEM